MKRIYFDNNATTPVAEEVRAAINIMLGESWGNPSSIHFAGSEAAAAIAEARESVAALFGSTVRDRDIVFTGSGSEADNLAIKGVFEQFARKGNHIITTQVEHPAVKNTLRYLEKKGAEVTWLPVDETGMIDLDQLGDSITDKTILITIMHANNETGVIFPIEKIGEIAREQDVLFHTDAVQSFGKLPLDAEAMKIDLISASGHKIYGPKGIGALYVRKGLQLAKQVHGGGQEMGRRAGTENTPGIVGFGVAAALARADHETELVRQQALRDKFWESVKNNIEEVKLNGGGSPRLPNTTNIAFSYIDGESVVLSLDMAGIAISSGSACTSEAATPSDCLKAMGLSDHDATASVRFSFGRYNTEEDVDHLIETLPPIIERVRSISPFWRNRKKA